VLPTTDGSAAGSGRVERAPGLARPRPAPAGRKISASSIQSQPWSEPSRSNPISNTLTRQCAHRAYEAAGVGPGDLDLVELHDCFASAELMHYDNLGLCEPGGAGDFIDSRAPWRDGTIPVNVSGGLLSKGHPIAPPVWPMSSRWPPPARRSWRPTDRERHRRPDPRPGVGVHLCVPFSSELPPDPRPRPQPVASGQPRAERAPGSGLGLCLCPSLQSIAVPRRPLCSRSHVDGPFPLFPELVLLTRIEAVVGSSSIS